MFDWCMRGKHDECKRSFRRFEQKKVKGKVEIVYTGEIVKCSCKKRGCKCALQNSST
jgi:hypothetical protein